MEGIGSFKNRVEKLRFVLLLVTAMQFSGFCFAEEGSKAEEMTIPAELKTAEVRMSPAHGLADNKARRKDASNILKIGDTYHVWYGRSPADVSWKVICTRPNVEEIWMATSKDGHHWTEHGRVLRPSKPGEWHGKANHAPHVMPWNGKYYLIFTAFHGRTTEHPCIGEKHIGLTVADQPEGPYEHVQDTPIFSPSSDPKAWDHDFVDDGCIIRRDGKFWLYYKGNHFGKGWGNKLGVAISEKITGPFKRPQAKPAFAPCHTGCVWPHGDGVAGISDMVNHLIYSSDGLHFRTAAKTPYLSDSGVYCPDAFDDAQKGRGITWGLCNKYEGVVGIQRFDCDLQTKE